MRASARAWVSQIVERSQREPMETEAVLKSLERNIGQGPHMLEEVRSILHYIDGELIERRGGQIMRDLWATVADYQEKVLEGQAAA